MYIGDIQILYPDATEENIPAGFAPVTETAKPNREDGHTISERPPVKVKGVWNQQWEKRLMTEEELTSYNAMGEEIYAKLRADGKVN